MEIISELRISLPLCLSILYCSVMLFFTVPCVLDLTWGFRHEGAEPTLVNLIMGKQCHGEIYVR